MSCTTKVRYLRSLIGVFYLSRNPLNSRNFLLPFGRDRWFAFGSKTVGWRFACHPDLTYLPQITQIFSQDYCFVRHSISKLSSALSYRNNYSDYFFLFFDALFDYVKNRATDLHRFFTRCASYIRTSLASARSPTVNPEGVIDYRRGCKPPVEIPPYTNPEGVAERTPSETFCP